MACPIFQIEGAEDIEGILDRAAKVIFSGGIVAVPTESFYGLATNAMDERAVRRLLAAKKVREPHPILTLIPSIETLHRYVRSIPPLAEALIRSFWPGGLTLVLEAAPDVPALLTAGTGKIGVRLPGHPVAAGLARTAGLPVTGTSANLTGEPPCVRAEEVLCALGGDVDLILDGGKTQGEMGSTVLDLSVDPPKVLREGMVGLAQLRPFIPGL